MPCSKDVTCRFESTDLTCSTVVSWIPLSSSDRFTLCSCLATGLGAARFCRTSVKQSEERQQHILIQDSYTIKTTENLDQFKMEINNQCLIIKTPDINYSYNWLRWVYIQYPRFVTKNKTIFKIHLDDLKSVKVIWDTNFIWMDISYYQWT